MKKKIFLPAGIAACLAVGIISSVSAADNTVNSASLKDVIESDNIFFDSLTGNFGKSEEVLPVAEPEIGSVATESAELSAVAAVSFDGEDDSYVESAPEVETADVRDEAKETASLPVSDTSDPAPGSEAVNAEYQVYTAASEEQPAATEDAATEEDIVELINNTVQTPAVTPDHSFDAKEISDLEGEIKPVTGQSPDDSEEGEIVVETTPAVQEEAQETLHEHEWKPVTETVHHDAVTHTEEVLVEFEDYSKTYSYCDEDGKTICNVYIHGTTVEYHDGEVFAVEGEETDGIVEISNLVTGEKFSFAPGELESRDAFVHEMFGDDVYPEAFLIGPYMALIEEKEVIDEEAYDEEVITGYICDCGEHKEL